MTSLSCEHDWELTGAPDHAKDMLPTGHLRRHVKTSVGSTEVTGGRGGCILKTQTSIEIWIQKNGHRKFSIIVKIGKKLNDQQLGNANGLRHSYLVEYCALPPELMVLLLRHKLAHKDLHSKKGHRQLSVTVFWWGCG